MAQKEINIPSNVAARIPYLRVYEEDGIFEIKKGVFSKTYKLEFSGKEENNKADMSVVNQQFAILLDSFDTDVKFEFTIHNRYIEEKEYLKNVILMPTNDNETKDELINNYNYLIADNINIGHNNVNKDKYFTVVVAKDIVDDALDVFKALDIKIKALFFGICEINAIPLNTVERMEVLHGLYHLDGSEKFGDKVDIEGTGVFNFKNMKYMKMSTKDVVGPQRLEEKKDHFIIDKKMYGRSFFINTIPSIASNNLITDLTNISSNMLFSIHYESIDAKDGFEMAAKLVGKNTFVTETADRRSVSARKNKKTIKTVSSINASENDYFNEVALGIFQEAVAKQQKVLLCTFAITLFSNNLEDLDRDSNLLKLSASKFVSQLKTLDLQQINGFNTSLPLGNVMICAKRAFLLERISTLVPLDIQATIKKDGVFMGLNAMNDNLVLVNRKNNINTNGLIAGVKYSGKTYQCKREIANAYMSTKDKIVVISTQNGDYDNFIGRLKGEKNFLTNEEKFFNTDEDYGLVEDKKIFKSTYLRAILAECREIESSYKDENERLDELEKWNEEEEEFERYLWKCNCNTTVEQAIKAMEESKCERIKSNLLMIKGVIELQQASDFDNNSSTKQVNLYYANNKIELLMLMDHIWNSVLEDKKNNITTWIFIDAIDDLILAEESSDYLQEFAVKCKQSKTILTMTVQESIQIFNESSTTYELLLEEIGYIKLLNQAPIERGKYMDILNIPNGLINYISDVEPGEGLIITPISNITFDDSFVENKNDGFYALFSEETEKTILDYM